MGAVRSRRGISTAAMLKIYLSGRFLGPVTAGLHTVTGLGRGRLMPVRCCETCGRTFTQGRGRPAKRCPEHRESGGRYGGAHRKLRESTKDQAYGRPCARCRKPMLPGEELHLDHLDGGGPADYAGWSHASCNMSSGAAKGNRMRGQVNGQRAPGGPSAVSTTPVPARPVPEPGSIRHDPYCRCGGRVTWQPGQWYTSRCW